MTQRCRLYLITPPSIDLEEFTPHYRAALDGGEVACVQLRLKDTSESDIRMAAAVLIPLAHERDIAFFINDRPDLAVMLGADGVHIGQGDISYEQARQIVGEERMVGVTCHNSRHLAMVAGESGADYVAFGAFYPTRTKTPKAQADPEIVTWWSELFDIPCVAIGGVTVDNCTELVKSGSDFLAVSSGIWDHPDGAAKAVALFNERFDEYAP